VLSKVRIRAVRRIIDELGISEDAEGFGFFCSRLLLPVTVMFLVGVVVGLALMVGLPEPFNLVAYLAVDVALLMAVRHLYFLVWTEDRLVLVRMRVPTYRSRSVVLDVAPTLCRARMRPTMSDACFTLETPDFRWRMRTSASNRDSVQQLVDELDAPFAPPQPSEGV
jgi:hypothetical protein